MGFEPTPVLPPESQPQQISSLAIIAIGLGAVALVCLCAVGLLGYEAYSVGQSQTAVAQDRRATAPYGATGTQVAERMGAARSQAAATEGAVAAGTAQAQAALTQAVRVTSTAQSLATRSAESVSLEQASAWPLYVSDSFDSNTTGWFEGRLDDGYVTGDQAVVGGVFRWTFSAKQGVSRVSASPFYARSDFYAAVDARRASGTLSSRYGLMFRYVDVDNFYILEASDSGYVWVYLKKAGVWQTLSFRVVEDINHAQFNNLMVVAHGAAYDVYVNGHLVDTIIDNALQEGKIGVGIEMYNEGDSSVFEFDNFALRIP